MLANKTIVLGITGGISAYKAVDLASKLVQAGAIVRVVMTKAATKFITPMLLRNITGNPVGEDMFAPLNEWKASHIGLAEAADLLVIAPATANTIANLALGTGDDLLTCTALATLAPVLIAPAMNDNMYRHAATQANIATLKARGVKFIDPAEGRLLTGKKGIGRLPDISVIVSAIENTLAQSQDLTDKNIVVTAGGTEEPIDAVRHIGNRSSGKMGYALAEAAAARGAKVTLITSSHLPAPANMKIIPVKTADEMKRAVTEAVAEAEALIMAAAVADYKPKNPVSGKIKKDTPTLTLELVRTPDILGEVAGPKVRVGFAAESENLIANAKVKLEKKRLDLIAANDITEQGSGFDANTNRVTLLGKDGSVEELPLLSKREVADRILDRVARLI